MASWNSRHRESPDSVDDNIAEFGWRAVRAGLHRAGREPTQTELDRLKPEEVADIIAHKVSRSYGSCTCGSLFDAECPLHGKHS